METHDTDNDDRINESNEAGCACCSLTIGTIANIRNELTSQRLLFRLNDEDITRHFAKRFFQGNVWDLTLKRLREVIVNLDGCPDNVPSNRDKFTKWVRKELLDFEHLPREKLAELYDWASKDLLEIKTNISDCRHALHEVEKRSPKTDEDPYDIRFYKYYQQLNQTAKREIVDVLTNRIHREALLASYRWPLRSLAPHVPWSFRWNPKRFEPFSFSPFKHAFRELTLRKFREVQQLYDKHDKTEFDQALFGYVEGTNSPDKIRRLLEEHHLLAARKTVIEPALEAFERGQFTFFASAVATQIEGIIEDGCLLSGISLQELRLGSISEKLDALVRDTSIYIDYVYYAFKFPILRNRIAHGRMLTQDIQRVARLLLLDLYDCCRVVSEHPGAPNALVELLRRVKPDMATLGDAVEFAAIYAETNAERPNGFYGLDQEFAEFTLMLDRQVVWTFLEELLHGQQRDELYVGLRLIADRLKKRVPTQRASCLRLLTGLGDRGKGEFDRDRFMTAARGDQGHRCLVKGLEEVRSLLIGVLRAREQWLQNSDGARA